jgi:hypothetical protein
MTDCNKVKDLVSRYIEGELFPENKIFVEKHLSICPGCKEAIRRVKILCQSLKGLSYLNTSPNFEERLHHRLVDFNNGSSSLRGSFAEHRWKMPAVGAVTVLVVVVLFMVFNSGNFQSEEPGNNPQNSPIVTQQSSRTIPQPQIGSNTTNPLLNQSGVGGVQDSLHEKSKKNINDEGVKFIDEKKETPLNETSK